MVVQGRTAKLIDLTDESKQVVRLVDEVAHLPEDDGIMSVSVKSPLGGAMLHRRIGETIQVHAPGGIVNYRIDHVQ